MSEKSEAVSMIDLLLRPEAPNVRAQLPRAEYKVKRLSQALEEAVVFQLQALPYGRVQELKELREDVEVQILLAGCAEPDLKDRRLAEKYGGTTPAETVKAMLLPGEIEDLSRAVERLCGYRRSTIEEIKNG